MAAEICQESECDDKCNVITLVITIFVITLMMKIHYDLMLISSTPIHGGIVMTKTITTYQRPYYSMGFHNNKIALGRLTKFVSISKFYEQAVLITFTENSWESELKRTLDKYEFRYSPMNNKDNLRRKI